MTDVKPRVVAVIPCYNTESHIAEVVTKCSPHVDQVIVVDDGSTDDTANEAIGNSNLKSGTTTEGRSKGLMLV